LLLLQARKYLIAHSTGTVTTSRTMMGRQQKQGNQFPHSKKLVQEPEGRTISLTEISIGLGLKAGRRFTKPMVPQNRQE
jgi:hypothetical protein